jgi:prepilin-type N-terminal cleavage/methylation domain-containing protein/prepilin-type processing-associated H-X9-DG protein
MKTGQIHARAAGRHGYTLIELIVVVAVIGILAGLAMPALGHARARAREAQCHGQLRQISLAMRLYADDDPQGLLPPDRRSSGDPAWIESLRPYLGNPQTVATCPADPFARHRRELGRTSYVLNQYTSTGGAGSEGTDPESFNNPSGVPVLQNPSSQLLDGFERPSETFLTFEVSNVGVHPDARGRLTFHDHTFADTWPLGWSHVLADIDPFRHGREAVYVFADGHVAAIPAERLRRRIEGGDNFAALRRR